MPQKKQTCQSEACAIQSCLDKNNYDEAKCQRFIRAMEKCCEASGYESYICKGFMPRKDHGTQTEQQ